MIYKYTPEQRPNVTAIKWVGDNLEEIQYAFPDETFRVSGISLIFRNGSHLALKGSYICQEEGDPEVYWTEGDFFEQNYTLEQFEDLKARQNSFWDDLRGPLDKVQRNWLRKTGCVIVTPIIFVVMGLVSGWLFTKQLFKDHWDLDNKNQIR